MPNDHSLHAAFRTRAQQSRRDKTYGPAETSWDHALAWGLIVRTSHVRLGLSNGRAVRREFANEPTHVQVPPVAGEHWRQAEVRDSISVRPTLHGAGPRFSHHREVGRTPGRPVGSQVNSAPASSSARRRAATLSRRGRTVTTSSSRRRTVETDRDALAANSAQDQPTMPRAPRICAGVRSSEAGGAGEGLESGGTSSKRLRPGMARHTPVHSRTEPSRFRIGTPRELNQR